MMIPKYTSLNDWCSSLVIDFPNDNVPELKWEDWKEFGNDLIQGGSFATNDAPSPDKYDNWEDWAYAIYYVMNNNG
ncbi:MAG TPA: hypothetical protein VHA52_09940 [Candidatus Babeliaceae bacterium]|nr:hypothetical protein [Candidatus Babeliaceae bacterium]